MVPEIEIECRHGDVTNVYAVFPDGDKKEIRDNDFLDYINAKNHNISIGSGVDIRDFFKGDRPVPVDIPEQVEDDVVNHPKHYNSHPSGIECIEIAEWYDFNIGNAIKYLWRNGLKHEEGKDDYDKAVEDLEKAVWYIENEIRLVRKKQENRLQK